MRKNVLQRALCSLAAGGALLGSTAAADAAEYRIDPAHSFVQFRIPHLGYSWLMGRFNAVSGNFAFDATKPGSAQVAVAVDTRSVDSNHAERDKHLRGPDFLDVEKHPTATFKSTRYTGNDTAGTLEGMLTLRGVTKPIRIEVQKIGEGKDPWGGYRSGFYGKTTIARSDFGISYNLGPAAAKMELELAVEGVKK